MLWKSRQEEEEVNQLKKLTLKWSKSQDVTVLHFSGAYSENVGWLVNHGKVMVLPAHGISKNLAG